jgi:hypothetical protein
MFEGLQVKENDIHGYRPGMTAYVVTADTPGAIALTRANPDHGDGGLPQLYVPAFKSVLEPVYSVPLK